VMTIARISIVFLGDKDSASSSTENNGPQSESGPDASDRNGDHGNAVFICQYDHLLVCRLLFSDEKWPQQMSRATPKNEMNVDLTPKRQKDYRRLA
jgi:hypothetical protein